MVWRSGQGAPSTIRCIKTCRERHRHQTRIHIVREHPAPSGALRPLTTGTLNSLIASQGAPSTIRCIKTDVLFAIKGFNNGQGAPSTIRCIKTAVFRPGPTRERPVREHPAPSGALRRADYSQIEMRIMARQGAPSTIRCIKTTVIDRTTAEQLARSGSTQHHQVH